MPILTDEEADALEINSLMCVTQPIAQQTIPAHRQVRAVRAMPER